MREFFSTSSCRINSWQGTRTQVEWFNITSSAHTSLITLSLQIHSFIQCLVIHSGRNWWWWWDTNSTAWCEVQFDEEIVTFLALTCSALFCLSQRLFKYSASKFFFRSSAAWRMQIIFCCQLKFYFHLQFLLNLFSWLTICRSRLGSRTSLGSCFLKNNVILESAILSLKIVFISQIFFCLHQHPARESQASWMVIEMSLFHLIGVKSFVELNHWSSVNVVCSTSFQDNLNCLTWDCWGYSVLTSPWSLRSRSTEDTRYINNK